MRLTVLLIISLYCLRCSERKKDTRKSFSKASEYNNFILDQIEPVDSLYISVIANSINKKDVIFFCSNLKVESTKSLKKLNIQAFKGDGLFCESAKKLLKHFIVISESDLRVFLIMTLDQKNKGVHKKQLDSLSNRIDYRYDSIWHEIERNQEIFSRRVKSTIK